jgi:hypothetical protein
VKNIDPQEKNKFSNNAMPMITRYALFEGRIHPGRAAVDKPLASPQRAAAKAATDAILEKYFVGRVHHHITQAVECE